jgi:hypothetical protein
MKWMAFAILAEIGVLLCLIFAFDGALHSLQSARLTWDHFAVASVYAYVRTEFSRRRRALPTGSEPRRETLPGRASI